MQHKLAAGNWKMNGKLQSLDMIESLGKAVGTPGCEVALCPPAHLLIPAIDRAAGGPVAVGAQNCHSASNGAFTGDIAADMLRDVGARFVIVGHSERRAAYGETDADVQAKAVAAQNAGLVPILCLGETLEQRETGQALPVIRSQLQNALPAASKGETLVIAYEPIWAIGTGKIPTMEEIAEVHSALRGDLVTHLGAAGTDVRILYGGSVKAGNAADIFAIDHVNGALVGGASLTTEDFAPIVNALSDT
ncbi:MAG: triose-phosphate isomerase [Pseudomonadota bacterium]